MAEAGQNAGAIVEAPPSAPPCSSCGCEDLEMRVLNCQHSLCEDCLEEKVKKINSFPMIITCPECTHVVIVESEENLRLQQMAVAATADGGRRRLQAPAPRDRNRPRHKHNRKSRRRQEPKVDLTPFLDGFLLKATFLISLAILAFCLLVYLFPSLRSPLLRSFEDTYLISVYKDVCLSPLLATFLFLLQSVSSVPATCRNFRGCLPTVLAVSAGVVGLTVTFVVFVFVTYAVVFLLQVVRKAGVSKSLNICLGLMVNSMLDWMEGVDQFVR